MSRCRKCIVRGNCGPYEKGNNPPGGCGRYVSHGTPRHPRKGIVVRKVDFSLERGTYQVFHRR